MTTRKAIGPLILTLGLLALCAPLAGAHTARELVTTFGPIGEPAGIAVDLETGDVYVTDTATDKVDIFGVDGGPPADGVPSQIADVIFNSALPQGVAIDNSCYEHQPRLTGKACEEYDPSYGDVYVALSAGEEGIRKFKLQGEAYQEVGFLQPEFGDGLVGTVGVAVDAQGNLYAVGTPSSLVVEFKKEVKEIANGNGVDEPVEETHELSFSQKIVPSTHIGYIAVDSSSDLYLGDYAEGDPSRGYIGVGKVRTDGSDNVVKEEVFTGSLEGEGRPVAVDSVTGNVLVGDGPEITEYNGSGALQLMFGSGEPVGGSLGVKAKGARAIAVNGVAERVYVANPAKDDVDVFGGAVGPPEFAEPQPTIEGVSRTSAVIAGSVNPEGATADYYFEYVEAGSYQPSSPEPYREGGRTAVTALAGGHSLDTVSRMVLSGLRPGTTYHYRMVASNASATVYGPDETFTTSPATPPTAVTGGAVEVSATGGVLTGVVDPQGLATSYVFEVGTDTGYAGAKLFGNAGASTGEVPVSVALEYLVPGTTYHYRLVATSFDGTSYGEDGSFTTPAVSAGSVQPAGVPLVASPSVQFPSLAGAIVVPEVKGKSKRTHRHKSGRRDRSRHAHKVKGAGGRSRGHGVAYGRSGG